jgi:methylthioribose-1-phosphate isomerase
MGVEALVEVPHPQPLSGADYSAVELSLDNATVWLLDQRRLPNAETYVAVRDVATLVDAIREMWVRGAPAIGIAAAYGVVLAAQQAEDEPAFVVLCRQIAAARPTAVNLGWAVERMLGVHAACASSERATVVEALAATAREIHLQDVAANRRIGQWGAQRIADGAVILTHCNAGALATGGYGTALGVVRAAHEAGKRVRVFADETRPWLQGARLTGWELARDGIDVTVIADGAAASLLAQGRIDLAVVGADRIVRNGDVANKIGTYAVACLCQLHERPFYVAAPYSTFDGRTPSGDRITIEERPASELTDWNGQRHVGQGISVQNPSFDITPARMVTALFTEYGVTEPLDAAGLCTLAAAASKTPPLDSVGPCSLAALALPPATD